MAASHAVLRSRLAEVRRGLLTSHGSAAVSGDGAAASASGATDEPLIGLTLRRVVHLEA